MEILSSFIIYFFSFIVLLSIIVFVHEFGHYYVAILNKVKVETFSIGFGKEIFGWNDKSGTRWKISMLPFGGYVKMFGEDIFSKKKIPINLQKYAFCKKLIYQRFLIVLAGPLANFIFGIIGFSLMYSIIGTNYVPPIVNEVQINSPAYISGLQKNDKIIKVDNNKIKNFTDISTTINLYKKKSFDFEILRDDKLIIKTIEPSFVKKEFYGEERNVAIIGISSLDPELKKYSFFKALYLGTESTYKICSLTLKALNQMFLGKGSFDDLGGPIKIAHFSGKMFEEGIISFFNLIILLSISIGLINLFPIPMLDGGHLVLYTIEFISGKPLNKKFQENLFKLGFIIIISLAVLLTYNDIINLFNF
tara:strand:- start:4572 stop:5660 length:1089 start_codon:yes stop_codon:yes gene_type:complete